MRSDYINCLEINTEDLTPERYFCPPNQSKMLKFHSNNFQTKFSLFIIPIIHIYLPVLGISGFWSIGQPLQEQNTAHQIWLHLQFVPLQADFSHPPTPYLETYHGAIVSFQNIHLAPTQDILDTMEATCKTCCLAI